MAETNFEKMLADFDGYARDHGYVRSKEWCTLKNVSIGMPNFMIISGKIDKFDYFKAGRVHYISIEKGGYTKCDDDFKEMVKDFEGYVRDHGYIRTAEYAEKNCYSPPTVRHWYLRGILKFPDAVKLGEVYYMREDFDVYPKLKKRGPKPKKK